MIRLITDERGSHTTELALAISLFALIAAFGFFFFGEALANFFKDLGTEFNTNTLKMPPIGDCPTGFTCP